MFQLNELVASLKVKLPFASNSFPEVQHLHHIIIILKREKTTSITIKLDLLFLDKFQLYLESFILRLY